MTTLLRWGTEFKDARIPREGSDHYGSLALFFLREKLDRAVEDDFPIDRR
jgi:hypothetical protein